MKITINKHSSICINDEIFFDPLHIEQCGKAKYIFLTHSHWDHFSVEDINKIITKNTVLICPKSMKELMTQFSNDCVLVEPEKYYKLDDSEFETFRAYNINKPYHPKENDWVGYNLRIENKNVAIVGDSDNTPELQKLKTDVLLIPIGGTYTMNVEEAVELTNIICPEKVIPTHYGEIVGNKEMGKEFAKLISKNIDCKILI